MIEIVRLCLLLGILGIASYHDVRTREIPDYLWIMGGSMGAILYVFDWDRVDYYTLFGIGTGGLLALASWRLFPMGDADSLAILVTSILYPVSFDVMITPVMMFFGGLILEHMAAFFYNVWHNVRDVLRYGSLFHGVECSNVTKFMAFYSTHRKRPCERFTFCAEECVNGKRRITLKTPSINSEYEGRTGVFVTWAMPAFPFMMAAVLSGVAVLIFS